MKCTQIYNLLLGVGGLFSSVSLFSKNSNEYYDILQRIVIFNQNDSGIKTNNSSKANLPNLMVVKLATQSFANISLIESLLCFGNLSPWMICSSSNDFLACFNKLGLQKFCKLNGSHTVNRYHHHLGEEDHSMDRCPR